VEVPQEPSCGVEAESVKPPARQVQSGERRGTLRRDPHPEATDAFSAFEASPSAAHTAGQSGFFCPSPSRGGWCCCSAASRWNKPLPACHRQWQGNWRATPGPAYALLSAAQQVAAQLMAPTAAAASSRRPAVATGGLRSGRQPSRGSGRGRWQLRYRLVEWWPAPGPALNR